MTTMPPEMTTAATPSVALSPTNGQRDSLSTLQSSRSRFMITDILAGSAVAAAAAMRNGTQSPPSNERNSLQMHHQHQHYHPFHQPQSQHTQLQQQHQQQQHAVALQHYLAQQQHLLQQHHHQQQQQQQQHHQQHFARSPSPQPPPVPPISSSSAASSTSSASTAAAAAAHPHLPSHHPLSHLPPAALIGFPAAAAAAAAVAGTPNGLHAAQAAAHYAALHQQQQQQQQQQHHHHQERERLRDLDPSSGGRGSTSLDHDDRSHSPHLSGIGAGSGSSACDLNGSIRNISSSGGGGSGGGGGGGGGGSSISGDQASTIDDSDSDTCGAKDDDGNSIKSDNLMGLSKKQRKARTAFTDHQLQTLEKSFERQKYLSVQDRMELANKLELSDCQVKTWYQNRRTKWKRQTAVGLELLAEAGNYAAFQRLYGGSPYLSAWPYATQSPHGAPPSAIDLYYRQAAAAAALQKPLSYRMYPSVPPMGSIPGLPVTPTPMTHLNASNSLSSLSSYYQTGLQPGSTVTGNVITTPQHALHSPVQSDVSDKPGNNGVDLARTPSPTLNPGSPPERTENTRSSCPLPSDDDVDNEDDEDAIEV